MTNLSTKDVKSPTEVSASKTLNPGNKTVTIRSFQLQKPNFPTNDGYFLIMNVEGPDMGEGFEGFYIDRDDPSQGRYKGQVGSIQVSRFHFEDTTLPSGVQVSRDSGILRALKGVAACLGDDCSAWFDQADGKYATIEMFVDAMNRECPFQGKYYDVCIGGREYENKDGYTNYSLYLPKFSRYAVPVALSDSPATEKLIKFSESAHIIPKKEKKAENISSSPSNGVGDLQV